MERRYIEYQDHDVYALCYAKRKIIYYNLKFAGKTKIYYLFL